MRKNIKKTLKSGYSDSIKAMTDREFLIWLTLYRFETNYTPIAAFLRLDEIIKKYPDKKKRIYDYEK